MPDAVTSVLTAARTVLVGTLLLPVHLWRATVAMRQPRCRFAPSCSTYAVTALRSHGPLRGSWLAVRRLSRCHPWNLGGIDHVPPVGRPEHSGPASSSSLPARRHDRNAA